MCIRDRNRAIVLLSGVLGYLLCLATFLYAIGFVGSILMPKSAAAELWSGWFIDRSDSSDDRRVLARRHTTSESQAPLDRSSTVPDQAKRVCFVRESCVNTPLDDGDCLEC